ncbi:MAG: ECF transporter S component [Bacillota bacterium]
MNREALRFLTRTAVLLGLTFAIQFLRLPQGFTGPAINFMLLVAAATVSPWAGVLIGLITPWLAFAFGILPAPLAPAIPFIMAGNATLSLTFGYIYRRRSLVRGIIGVVAAAVLKLVVLGGAVRYLLALPPKISVALQIPQLYTALSGGVVALVVIAALERISLMQE